jgi:hypothetical protein
VAVVVEEEVAEVIDPRPATSAVVVKPVVDARVANSSSTTTTSQPYERAEVDPDY